MKYERREDGENKRRQVQQVSLSFFFRLFVSIFDCPPPPLAARSFPLPLMSFCCSLTISSRACKVPNFPALVCHGKRCAMPYLSFSLWLSSRATEEIETNELDNYESSQLRRKERKTRQRENGRRRRKKKKKKASLWRGKQAPSP